MGMTKGFQDGFWGTLAVVPPGGMYPASVELANWIRAPCADYCLNLLLIALLCPCHKDSAECKGGGPVPSLHALQQRQELLPAQEQQWEVCRETALWARACGSKQGGLQRSAKA